MAGVKRPRRPQFKGLVFSSSGSKRGQDDQNDLIPSKRNKVHASANEAAPTSTTTSPIASPTATATVTITHQPANFLILSDTHGKSKLPQVSNVPIDVVLHCGDLSECGQLEDYRKTIDLLAKISAPLKLVVAGNHDLTLDEKFWSQNATKSGANLHKQAQELWRGKEARDAGIILLNDGLHEFKLANGSKLKIYASSATPNGTGVPEWAFGHRTGDDIYNPLGQGVFYSTCTFSSTTKIEDGANIDVIMTHGPAKYRLDKSKHGGESIGCPHLFRALRRSKPALHVFGHVHQGYGAELVEWADISDEELPEDDDDDDGIKQITKIEGTEGQGVRQLKLTNFGERQATTCVNAALMGDGGELKNLPWYVQINLKRDE